MTEIDASVLSPIRESIVLTNSEVFHQIRGADSLIEKANQLSLLVDFTIGSLTNALIKIYTSDDGLAWKTLPSLSITAGVVTVSDIVITLTESAAFNFETQINTKFIRVGVTGTGTVTSSLMEIIPIIGVK